MQPPQYDNIIPAASFAGVGVQIAPVRPYLRRWVQCLWVAYDTNRNETFHHEKLYPDAGSSLTFEISPNGAQVAFFTMLQFVPSVGIYINAISVSGSGQVQALHYLVSGWNQPVIKSFLYP